jgi:hypothetical protein
MPPGVDFGSGRVPVLPSDVVDGSNDRRSKNNAAQHQLSAGRLARSVHSCTNDCYISASKLLGIRFIIVSLE